MVSDLLTPAHVIKSAVKHYIFSTKCSLVYNTVKGGDYITVIAIPCMSSIPYE